MASIIVVSGPSEGDYYPLAKETVVIGRDAACPIQIVDDQISRVHLEIRFDKANTTYSAIDMQSVNGVTINDKPITAEIELAAGDIIGLGSSRIMYFDREFADRKSAWDFYKIADQRKRGTMLNEPDRPLR